MLIHELSKLSTLRIFWIFLMYSKLELELARFRGILEKKYANDYDAGYTYIDPATGDSVPLTPFMMKEWARAMVSNNIVYFFDCHNLIILIAVRWNHGIKQPPKYTDI